MMNRHTRLAKAWLDRRYSRDHQGRYLAHQPISGLHTDCSEPNAVQRLARTYRLLQLLATLEFRSLLDVGGGEGYLAALVRDLFGPSAAHSLDLSAEACQRAGEIFGIQGLAADITRLPFADDSYDVVVCSEVIEHLSRPVFAIGELQRVARKYVVISTGEFCPTGELERTLRSWTLDRSYPHAELNWFTAGDFRTLLGDRVFMGSQFHSVANFLPDRRWNRDEMEQLLASLTASTPLSVDHTGVLVIASKDGLRLPGESSCASGQRTRILDRLLDPPARVPERSDARDLDHELLSRLTCVLCGSAVRPSSERSALQCVECRRTYALKGPVPVMMIDDSDLHSGAQSSKLEEACVVRLGAGRPDRERSIRRLVARLHDNESTRSGALKRSIATQLLRVLWFLHRDEPLAARMGRLLRRFRGARSVRQDELQAILAASTETPGD